MFLSFNTSNMSMNSVNIVFSKILKKRVEKNGSSVDRHSKGASILHFDSTELSLGLCL